MKGYRTCLLCGEREVKERLQRLVVSGQKIQVDLLGSAAGRGGYLHRKRCKQEPVELLSRQIAKRWARAFRVRITSEMVRELLEQERQTQSAGLLITSSTEQTETEQTETEETERD